MNRTEKYAIQKFKTAAAKHKIGTESCCYLNECLNEKKSLLKKNLFLKIKKTENQTIWREASNRV